MTLLTDKIFWTNKGCVTNQLSRSSCDLNKRMWTCALCAFARVCAWMHMCTFVWMYHVRVWVCLSSCRSACVYVTVWICVYLSEICWLREAILWEQNNEWKTCPSRNPTQHFLKPTIITKYQRFTDWNSFKGASIMEVLIYFTFLSFWYSCNSSVCLDSIMQTFPFYSGISLTH